MKGIVFNLLQEVVTQAHGEDTWDRLLAEAGLDGAYTSVGSYPDDEMGRLVGAGASLLNQPAEAVLRWFGREALPLLARRFPKLFEGHASVRSLLLALNGMIHPEVRKLYPGAEVPEFQYQTKDDKELVMAYRSSRRLCAFAQGLIEGAAGHYGERVLIEHPQCMNRGQDACVFRVRFAGQER